MTEAETVPRQTIASWPAHETAQLTEAFRRAVLRLLVRRELFDEDQAQAMLQWPHSGFHAHDSVWVSEDDRPFAERLARYCARNPVALERLTYDADDQQVTYRSDKADGPTAGSETVNPLEFWPGCSRTSPTRGRSRSATMAGMPIARVACGCRQAAPTDAAVVVVPARPLSRPEAAHRWAELLRQIFEVDPLTCPTCGAAMRIVAFITVPAVIDRILTHLRTRSPPGRAAGARRPPNVRRSGAQIRRDSRPPQPNARPACNASTGSGLGGWCHDFEESSLQDCLCYSGR